jgi:hypothetical protein
MRLLVIATRNTLPANGGRTATKAPSNGALAAAIRPHHHQRRPLLGRQMLVVGSHRNTLPERCCTWLLSPPWQALMALNTTDAAGGKDLATPPEVRLYFFAGTQHGGGRSVAATAVCAAQAAARLPIAGQLQFVLSGPTRAANRLARLDRRGQGAAGKRDEGSDQIAGIVSMPAMNLNSSPAICGEVPTPGEAMLIRPGRALA